MRTGCVAIVAFLGVLGLAAPSSADDAPPVHELDPEAIRAAAEEARFGEYVQRGDRARASGRMADAVLAYSEALNIRPDPLIAGRLGIVLVELGKPARAAHLLHDAVNRDWRARPVEREQFKTAYDAARAVVCMLDVTISHVPERTTLDGDPINPKHRTGFFIFAMPGEHEIRASLTGYRDGRAVFTACKGGSMDVPVMLSPLPSDTSIEPTPAPKPPPEPAAIPAPPGLPEIRLEPLGDPRLGIAGAVGVVDGKPLSKQEDPYAYDDPSGGDGKKSGVRGSIGAGPVMVLGVASWAPAFGVALSGGLRFGSFSLGVEVRGAWLPFQVGDGPISAMTAGGTVAICGHWRWFLGCGIGHLGVMRLDTTADSFVNSDFVRAKLGGGVRLGAEIPLSGPFAVIVAGDALALTSGTRAAIGSQLIVDQPPVMLAGNLLGTYRF
ncbi:hypothetical protein [Polyangium sp. 15x6]|uniref:tetratricopeptide repeat protein n=1 Tax=Polyangium sp. 15x6 TaxID=3042687 RepID=UPI00249A1E64|nr:hypothetical protein [Polyangium sp. 15x6]MDI3287360.1 hypothetical protein [Polyangium sp. 15x6]